MKLSTTLFFGLFFFCSVTSAKDNIELSKWLDNQNYPANHNTEYKYYESRGLVHNVSPSKWSPDIWYSYKEDFTDLFEKVCEIKNDQSFVHAHLISGKKDYAAPLSFITKLIANNKTSIVDLSIKMDDLKDKFGVADITQIEKNQDAMQIVYRLNHHQQPIAVNFYINKNSCLYATVYYYK